MQEWYNIHVFEYLQHAIYLVNKRSSEGLSRKTVILLIVVFRAEQRGLVMNQEAVLNRLLKTHNNGSRVGDITLIEYLVERGYLAKKKEGRSLIISTTVAGRNYVTMLSKTLRDLRSRL
jgi:hypothetical protein